MNEYFDKPFLGRRVSRMQFKDRSGRHRQGRIITQSAPEYIQSQGKDVPDRKEMIIVTDEEEKEFSEEIEEEEEK